MTKNPLVIIEIMIKLISNKLFYFRNSKQKNSLILYNDNEYSFYSILDLFTVFFFYKLFLNTIKNKRNYI